MFGLLSAHPITPLIIWLLVLIKVDRRAKSKTSTIPLTKEGKYALKNNLLLNLYLSSCTVDLLSKLTEIPRKYISRKIEYLPNIFCAYGLDKSLAFVIVSVCGTNNVTPN